MGPFDINLLDVPFPVLGKSFLWKDYEKIDLSVENPHLNDKLNQNELKEYIDNHLSSCGSVIAYGGYLEKRNLYKHSTHFDNHSGVRDIHLGIDLWTNAGQIIYCPLDAEVHSFRYNSALLDYGYTIILKHSLDRLDFYTLYGHLGKSSFLDLHISKKIKRGEAFARIGDEHENGGWVPHLHLQMILEIGDWKGDYPGVCSGKDKADYKNNCPNPLFLVFANHADK